MNPSRDPANDDSLIGLFRQAQEKFLQNIDDMLPATVIAFDRAANRVQVQPMIKVVGTDGTLLSRAQIINLPVIQAGGGGAVLLFTLSPGDLGWIKSSDRDLSLFLQDYNEAKPNTFRKHSFSDAVFIPDAMRGWTLNGEDAECALLQSLDGSLRISLGNGRIKMTAGSKSVEVSPSIITMTGDVMVNGSLVATGDIAGNGISLSAHTHSGVTVGVGNTGVPNP